MAICGDLWCHEVNGRVNQEGIGSGEGNRRHPPWPIQKTSKMTMTMDMREESGNEDVVG